jgi:hypothetical protein
MRLRAPWLFLFPVVALATTIVPHSLVDRAREADRVALVQVLESRAVVEGDAERGAIKTLTRLLIGQDVKGTGPREVTVVQIGGQVGARALRIPGDAAFVVGETALVFLKCRSPERCALVALGEGRLSVVGEGVVYRDLFSGQWVHRPLLDVLRELSTLVPPASPVPPLSRGTR